MLSLVNTLPESPALERVRAEVAKWPGVTLEAGLVRGSTEFHYKGRVLGAVYPVAGGEPAADLIVPTAVGDALIAQRRAQRHAMVPAPGWITVVLDTTAAVDNAIALFRDSYARQNRPLRLV